VCSGKECQLLSCGWQTKQLEMPVSVAKCLDRTAPVRDVKTVQEVQ